MLALQVGCNLTELAAGRIDVPLGENRAFGRRNDHGLPAWDVREDVAQHVNAAALPGSSIAPSSGWMFSGAYGRRRPRGPARGPWAR